jgi:hypothetical protein
MSHREELLKRDTNLATFRDCVWLLVLVGAHTKVLDCLPGVPLAAEQDSVGTSRRTERELVEGDGLTAGLQNTLLGGLSEAEGRNSQLRDLEQTNVIGDSSNDNDSLGITIGRVGGFLEDTGKGNRRTVDLGKEQAVEDSLRWNA